MLFYTNFYKNLLFLTLILSIIGAFFTLDSIAVEPSKIDRTSEYVIGPGDSIEIYVWKHDDLTKDIRVRPDGKTLFPIIGELQLSGITPSILAREIEGRLSKYIKEPKVSVIVKEYSSKKILILGEVEDVGLYQYEGDMTAFDAIGLASGYKRHAELRSILVIRDANSTSPQICIANLYKVIHDGDLSENVALKPNDIIYVPKNFIGNVGEGIDFFLSKIQPIAGTYFFYTEAVDGDD